MYVKKCECCWILEMWFYALQAEGEHEKEQGGRVISSIHVIGNVEQFLAGVS